MPKSFDELVKSPLDPWWCRRGAPDAASMIAATRVQMLMAAGNCGSAEDYIIEAYGETRERAAEIVRNCQDGDAHDYEYALLFSGKELDEIGAKYGCVRRRELQYFETDVDYRARVLEALEGIVNGGEPR